MRKRAYIFKDYQATTPIVIIELRRLRLFDKEFLTIYTSCFNYFR